MIAIRRKTRETLRHERAVVRQQLGTPPATAVQQDIEANKLRAAELRRAARRRGGGPDEAQRLGLVTKQPRTGGTGASSGDRCPYCGQVNGHTAQCPVVS